MATSMAHMHPAERVLAGTQGLIDAHLRPQGQDALVRLSNFFADPVKAAEAVRTFSKFDVERIGFVSPKDFLRYVTTLPMEPGEAVTIEEAVLMIKDLDTHQDGRIYWKHFGAAIELASARQVSLATMDADSGIKPHHVMLEMSYWRDPNVGQQHKSMADLATKNAVQFRFASLKALQAPLEDIDRAFLSQFISIMRRDGMKVLKHGKQSVATRKVNLNNKATHVTWNSPRTMISKSRKPAVMALNDVVEVNRGAFPGSVAMPAGKVKRCVALVTPKRVLFMECLYEEDADLLFAGLSILSLGKASKKMEDQRRKLKDMKREAELNKLYRGSAEPTGLEGTVLRIQAEEAERGAKEFE